MPARSNEFQRLIFLVKKLVAPDAIVTESKLLVDRRTGTGREVDVCIEATIGGHPVVVAVECRDHGRRADLTWVEQMQAKHEHLPTNALVLASRSGFTGGAVARARAGGLELLPYGDLSEESVKRLFGFGGTLWGASYELSVTKVVAEMAAVESIPSERVSLLQNNSVFTADGRLVAAAREVVQRLLRGERIPELLYKREANESHRSFVLKWNSPALPSGERLSLEKLTPRRFIPIDRLEITGTCRISVCEFRLRYSSLGPVQVAWGTGELESREAMLVAVAEQGSPQQLTLHLEKVKTSEKTSQPRRKRARTRPPDTTS